MQILRVWPERQVQLPGDGAAGKESGRSAQRVAEAVLLGLDRDSTRPADSESHRGDPLHRLSSQRYQTGPYLSFYEYTIFTLNWRRWILWLTNA